MDLDKIIDDVKIPDEYTYFKELPLLKKYKLIEAIFNDDIRPMLIADGGNAEILDISETEDEVLLDIRYIGACSGCAFSSSGTLQVIQETLSEKTSYNITVRSV